jgi:hypothetical protein
MCWVEKEKLRVLEALQIILPHATVKQIPITGNYRFRPGLRSWKHIAQIEITQIECKIPI